MRRTLLVAVAVSVCGCSSRPAEDSVAGMDSTAPDPFSIAYCAQRVPVVEVGPRADVVVDWSTVDADADGGQLDPSEIVRAEMLEVSIARDDLSSRLCDHSLTANDVVTMSRDDHVSEGRLVMHLDEVMIGEGLIIPRANRIGLLSLGRSQGWALFAAVDVIDELNTSSVSIGPATTQ